MCAHVIVFLLILTYIYNLNMRILLIFCLNYVKKSVKMSKIERVINWIITILTAILAAITYLLQNKPS